MCQTFRNFIFWLLQWLNNSIVWCYWNYEIKHINKLNKLTRFDEAIHLTLPYTSGFIFCPPPHFGRLVFAFLVFWWSTDYVYKIWLSLVQGPRFSFLPPPPFWAVSFCIFSLLVVHWLIMYTKFGWVCSNDLDFYFLTPSP